ncbi:MAG: FAD-dependent oxidoreductase [Acidobacteria bacterium]|nr:FAD-dependent oxidoreductase [Acidobacteriota bacterium]
MRNQPAENSMIVIGAGMAGLLAAHRLQSAGRPVVVLEKARGVGGRMSVRRSAEGNWDHGAQFFAARESAFRELTDTWLRQGLLREWGAGFPSASGQPVGAVETRYCGRHGMNEVAKHLARDLTVHTSWRAWAISRTDGGWRVVSDVGQEFFARAILVTTPVPQALALFDQGDIPLPAVQREQLESLTYQKCLALLLALDGPSRLPDPGGMFSTGEPVAWLADNYRKGISADGYTVTILAGPGFSVRHWDDPPAEICQRLKTAAAPWLGADMKSYQLHRWRYSQPLVVYPERFFRVDTPAPLLLAGDAFGGPRVEGAALSGLAAAEWLLNQ